MLIRFFLQDDHAPMRLLDSILALAAAAATQSSSHVFLSATKEPCTQASETWSKSKTKFIPAELAYNCLASIPVAVDKLRSSLPAQAHVAMALGGGLHLLSFHCMTTFLSCGYSLSFALLHLDIRADTGSVPRLGWIGWSMAPADMVPTAAHIYCSVPLPHTAEYP